MLALKKKRNSEEKSFYGRRLSWAAQVSAPSDAEMVKIKCYGC